jgi:vacuolar protein sorting-associated protein 13A/C
MWDGMTGIVTDPMDGAREAGLKGFTEGMAKGLIGAVVKPTEGVVDLGSGLHSQCARLRPGLQLSRRLKRRTWFLTLLDRTQHRSSSQ